MTTTMRLHGTKTLGYKIELLEWSHKMDLLAMSNDKGEVIVQRLNWQKIWLHAPPDKELRVKGISWRFDEKVIAIGYSNGLIILLDVEHEEEIGKITLEGEICSMNWTENTKEIDTSESESCPYNPNDGLDTYLPPLPSLSSLCSSSRRADFNSTRYNTKKVLNFFVVGLKSGKVHISAFGIFACGTIDVAKEMGVEADQIQIQNVKMSSDFRQIYIFLVVDKVLKMLVFKNEIYYTNTGQLLSIAVIYSHVLNLISYINSIMEAITEAYEAGLLELDTKLSKYANSQEDGSVSADLLELLVFGCMSEPLEQFLTKDITEKGLRKIGNSVDMSYSTMQKLAGKPLHSAILNIFFQLNTLKGMSRNKYYYGSIISEIDGAAYGNAGAFMIKGLEFQQIIDQSSLDYKKFWCWLDTAFRRIADDRIELPLTQQENYNLAEFLFSFEENIEVVNGKKKFNLERVAQYLKNKNLEYPPKESNSERWNKLLAENACLLTGHHIYPHHHELSLVQEYIVFVKSVTGVFDYPQTAISKQFQLEHRIDCADIRNEMLTFSAHHHSVQDDTNLFVGVTGPESGFFIEIKIGSEIKSLKFELHQRPFFDHKFINFGELTFRHLQIYHQDIVTVLLDHKKEDKMSSCLVQFPLNIMRQKSGLMLQTGDASDIRKSFSHNFYDLLDAQLVRQLDNFDAHMIAVTGHRRMAAVLSENRKRLRIYEMESEEDEDEMDTTQDSNILEASNQSNQSV